MQNVPANAAAKVGMRVDNVAGVKIPVFEKHEQEVKTQDLTGLAAGGQKVEQSRTTFVSDLRHNVHDPDASLHETFSHKLVWPVCFHHE